MHDEAPELGRTLHRIADVLGMPVEALFIPDSGKAGPSKDEVDALLIIFTSLNDRQARNRIFAAALAEMRRLQPGTAVVPDGRI